MCCMCATCLKVDQTNTQEHLSTANTPDAERRNSSRSCWEDNFQEEKVLRDLSDKERAQ